jgi:hypothetical protein
MRIVRLLAIALAMSVAMAGAALALISRRERSIPGATVGRAAGCPACGLARVLPADQR